MNIFGIFLMFVGVISFFYGLFSVFGIIKEDTSKDSEMSQRLYLLQKELKKPLLHQ